MMYVLYVSQKSSFNVKPSVTAILRDKFGINDLENNYLFVVKILCIFGIEGKRYTNCQLIIGSEYFVGIN